MESLPLCKKPKPVLMISTGFFMPKILVPFLIGIYTHSNNWSFILYCRCLVLRYFEIQSNHLKNKSI